MSIRVLIADDQAVVRIGFRTMLGAEPDIDVVDVVSEGNAAVERAIALRPDVVMMDIRMPGLDGLQATRRIVREAPGVNVLVVTTFDPDEYVFGALRVGAAGFLLKDTDPDQLVAAVRQVARGDGVIDPALARRLIDEFSRHPGPASPDGRLDALTPREREILVHIARGLTNAEIATTLVVGESTVKTHVGNVLDKLDLAGRVQAVIFAYESGLVRPGGHGDDDRR